MQTLLLDGPGVPPRNRTRPCGTRRIASPHSHVRNSQAGLRPRRLVAALALVVTLALAFPAVADTNVALPPASQILKTLKTGHPRLLASEAEFAALKKRIPADPTLAAWYAKVKEQATHMLTEPVSKYEIPDGLRLLSTSRRVLNRMQYLGLMHHLDGDKRWAERAWKELAAAAAFQDWNPRHFLDTAEMTHAFALGYDWFYRAWTPQQRSTLKEAMIEKGLKLALGVHRGNRGRSSAWNRVRHNWNQVCNGGITVGALAIADEEQELAAELIKAGCESVQLAMAEFAPDGAWNEGPGYWGYATIYNFAMLASLKSALGTEFGLSEIPGFKECGTFPIYATGPLGRTFNYADSSDGTIRAPHLFWMAKEYQRPQYAAYQAKVAYPSPLDLLWYDASLIKPVAAPLDKYFRASEVVTMRSAWDDRNAWFVGFKAGDNKANHSNLDLGSFVLDQGGERWFVDLGADDYNLPGYFGRQRWTYYRMRAESHNTVILNPSPEPDQDPRAATKVVRFESEPKRAFAIADLTPAYAKDAQSVHRGIALLDRSRMLVQDEIKAKSAADLWWFAHTQAEIAIVPGGRAATLTQNGKTLRATLHSPASAKFQQLAAAPLPASTHPEKQNPNRGIRKLAVQLPKISDATIVVTFEGQARATAPELTPLAKW